MNDINPDRLTAANNNRLFVSLGLHSAAIIAFQLVLMQLLSTIQWHHFAFMVISIAMLGFGASGTFIALFRKKIIANFSWLYSFLMVATGLSMIIVFPLSRINAIEFDVFKLFSDYNQIWVLAANYLIFFIPFFLGATSIGMIFIKMPKNIGKCYFSNLLGSGIGGIVVLILVGWLFPEQVMIIAGLMAILAGIIAAYSKKKIVLTLSLSTFAIFLAIFFLVKPFDLKPSEYKSISKTLNLPDSKIEFRKPDRHGIIEIVSSPALRYAPSLSMSYNMGVPVKKSVFINGNFLGVIPIPLSDNPHIHSYTTMALPYIMQKRDNVLVLNASTGSSIAHALSQSASNVDASIDNLGIINIMQGPYAEESGYLFQNKNVNIIHSDARIYLSGVEKGKYDLIDMPVMEAFGGTSGLNSLQENYELTIEAFSLMWEALSEEGVITVTSWMDYPPRTTLKLLATIVETARNKGVENPVEHIAAIRSWGTITYALKRTPISSDEIENIKSFCNEMFFDPAILFSSSKEEREHFNKLDDASFFDYIDKILHSKESEMFADYGFAIKPATDNKPYFSQFLKLKNLKHIISIYGIQQLPYLELGYLTVLVTLIQSTILAIILIVLPLLRLKNTGKKKFNIFVFFAAIGIGYMFLEIILIQKFVLYFGYPIYAITAVISTMLIASGIGSLVSARFNNPLRFISIIAFIILSIMLIYAIFLTPILQNTLSMTKTVKFVISLLLIAIPAFFMGMPFPMAIRYISDNSPALIPWAWGINGCFSVISTSLAMFLALEIGFVPVMIGAVVCYLLASLAFAQNLFIKVKGEI